MSDALLSFEVVTSPSQIAATWLQQEKLSTHMSGFARHAASRSSWRGQHDRVFVRISTDDGHVGVGATRGTASAVVVLEHLAQLLRGRRLSEHAELYAELAASQLTYGWSGIGAAALSAVDLALWDLRATAEGRSLGAVLVEGRTPRESLPCYTTVHPERVPDITGFAGVKIAARFGPCDGTDAVQKVAQDVRRVREQVGADTLVMVDTACSWTSDFVDAVLSELDEGQLDWLEDPLLPWDRAGYERIGARIAGWSGAPKLCLGNYSFSRLEAQQVLSDGLVDVLQPDLTWVGGLTAARELQEGASAHGVAFSPHYGAMHPWAVQLLAAIPEAELAEYIATSQSAVREDYPELPVPVLGRQPVPSAAGSAAALGAEVLDAGIAHRVSLLG